MQKIGLMFLLVFAGVTGWAQMEIENLRLGFHISPVISIMGTNDETIPRDGANLGIQIGAIGEYYLNEHFSLTSGLNLSFHQGGKIRHDVGGNFFPNSELSDDVLNTGIKPLPDDVRLTYSMQFLELPFALKIRTAEIGYYRLFFEVPKISFAFRTQARGDIEGNGVSSEKENIRKDVKFLNFFAGFGLGGEYALSETNSAFFGIYIDRSLIDITKNDGFKAFMNPNDLPGNPSDDYIQQPDLSKASMTRIRFRLGLLF